MKIDLTMVLAVLVAVGAVATYAASAVRGLRTWVKKTAGTAQRTEEQLTTASGVPIAVHIESTAHTLSKIESRLDRQDERLDVQDATVRETHDIAVTALARATDVRDRLDHHLIRDHGAVPAPVQE
jgi:NADH:ubiquinone oxidoreductase subunit 6 (subunit J)